MINSHKTIRNDSPSTRTKPSRTPVEADTAYAGKECTEYAIAATAARLTQAVLCDEHYATACSTLLTGEQGESGNYASLPCIIGANGVEEVLNPTLTESEQAKFHASCEHIRANIAQLAWWNDECHPILRG